MLECQHIFLQVELNISTFTANISLQTYLAKISNIEENFLSETDLFSLITAVTLVICCFKYGCPLYDTCSGGYTRRDTLPGCYGTGEYEGSDQDLLTGNGNVKEHVSKAPGKKFYATASDKHINADKAQHV